MQEVHKNNVSGGTKCLLAFSARMHADRIFGVCGRAHLIQDGTTDETGNKTSATTPIIVRRLHVVSSYDFRSDRLYF